MEQKQDHGTGTTVGVDRPVYHRPMPEDPSAIIVEVERHEHTVDVTFDVLHTRGTFVRTFSLDRKSVLPHVTMLQEATTTHGDEPYDLLYAEVKITAIGDEWRIDGVELDDDAPWLTAGRLAASGVVVSGILTAVLTAVYTLVGSLLLTVIGAVPVAFAWIVTIRAFLTAREKDSL